MLTEDDGRVFEIKFGKAYCAAKELHKLLAECRDGRGGVGNIKANFIFECYMPVEPASSSMYCSVHRLVHASCDIM